MKTFDCSAILFDLDGVLVDSTHSVTRQWRRWADENNIDPQRVVEIAHGVRTIEIVPSMVSSQKRSLSDLDSNLSPPIRTIG